MKKKTKNMLLMSLMILVLSLTGCSFHVGDKESEIMDKDFDEIFDREEERGAYTHSMLMYDIITPEHGKMVVVLDTSEGHTFEMDESGNFFTVFDKDHNEILKTNFYLKENYAQDTASLTDVENINYRDFFVGEYIDGHYAMSYMADCGLDLGVIMQSKDKESFRLVAFGGVPLEGSSSDIYFYQGTTKDSEISDTGDNIITFKNGKSFQITEYDIEPFAESAYKLSNDAGLLEACSYENADVEEITNLIEEKLSKSDATPIIDCHKEGNYLTGIYDNQLICAFVADDEEGDVYALILYTHDGDNATSMANSFVDDLLAADFMGGSVRTVYGEPVADDEDTTIGQDGEDEDISDAEDTDKTEGEASVIPDSQKYYKIPQGYECSYSCEFFENYSTDDIEITFNFEIDEEIKDFLEKDDAEYYDLYVLSFVTTVDTGKGELSVVKATYNNDLYAHYYVMSEDGKINFNFVDYSEKEWTEKDFETFIKQFIS